MKSLKRYVSILSVFSALYGVSPHARALSAEAAGISQSKSSGYPVIINEIFPRATAWMPEWIELVNISTVAVNLKHWQFMTAENKDKDTITSSDCILEPGRFIVVAKSSKPFDSFIGIRYIQSLHWQALDNYHDTIRLFNPADTFPCEVVYYASEWFAGWDNQSLERVSFTGTGTNKPSWVLADRPTPGLPNGAGIWQSQQSPDVSIGPVPFTPDNDGTDDVLG